jgi:nucleotide-binding universal stress UspA family protein
MLRDAGLEHEILQPTSGRSAAEEILATAEKHDASMIVIGLRKRSAVGKLLTGSTAQTILLEAACPVLAVKVSDVATSRLSRR